MFFYVVTLKQKNTRKNKRKNIYLQKPLTPSPPPPKKKKKKRKKKLFKLVQIVDHVLVHVHG